MVLKLRRVPPLPFAVVLSGLHTVVGFVLGAVVVFGTLLPGQANPPLPGLGLWALLVLPVINAAIGFVAGASLAGLYNFLADWFGGIVLECDM